MAPDISTYPFDRMFKFINKDGPIPSHRPDLGPCWIWTGAGGSGGRYGYVTYYGVQYRAHRMMWYHVHGKWPDHLACHHCDVGRCVNPDHLFDGTPLENAHDAISKGRYNTPAIKEARAKFAAMVRHKLTSKVIFGLGC